MKKIPFYNPASPFFFHISVLLFIIPIVLTFFLASGIPFIFSVLYPFFALSMAIIVRRVYIHTYQVTVPEDFANKLVLYNRYLISISYIFLPLLALFSGVDYPIFVSLIILVATGPWFLFCISILPVSIRFVLLNKMRSIDWVITIGIFFFLFLSSLFIIWKL